MQNRGGEPLLAEIERYWGADAGRLVPLVDGWENLLGERPMASEDIEAFAAGRGEALGAFAELAGESTERAAATVAGRTWALSEFATPSSDPDERASALMLAANTRFILPRSRALRGLSVLGGLANRALQAGQPLLHDRRAVLTAIRLGMLGR